MIGFGLAVTGQRKRRGLSFDFTTGVPPGLTFSRAGAGMAQKVDGSWASFVTGVPRQTDRGLLVEEARTNLNPNSNLNPLPASSVNMVATTGSASPIIGNTARAIARQAASTNSYVQQTIATQALGTVLTVSVLAKAGVGGRIGLRISGAYPDRADAVFDLTAGTVVGTNAGGVGYTNLAATIIPQAGGFYRCILTTTTGNSAATSVLVGPTDSTRTVGSWEGPTTALCSADFDLFQCEVGSVASSLIPTAGASATRGLDLPVVPVDMPVGRDFTITAEIEFTKATGAVQTFFEVNDGTFNNRIVIARASSGSLNAFLIVGGVSASIGQISNMDGARTIKVAISRQGSIFNAAGNGVSFPNANVSGAFAATLTQMLIGKSGSSTEAASDHVKKVSVNYAGSSPAQMRAMTA